MAKLCVHPSCKVVVREEGECRCEKHKLSKKKHTNELRKVRGRRNAKIYDSARWKRISDKKRQIAPFCEKCLENGIEVLCNVVDHIVELEDGGEPFNMKNLMSLCHSCHNKKTADEKRKRSA